MDMDAQEGKLRYDSALCSLEGAQWRAAGKKEFDRLVEETGTGEWITLHSVPKGRVMSYYNPQLSRNRRSEETHPGLPGGIEFRVRGTYGGDRGDYKGPTMAETADIATASFLTQIQNG
jgi:hypothetical protein